jgi:hypothetical protein
MRVAYPDEERSLQHSPDLAQRLKAGVHAPVTRGVPYREADRPSDAPVLQAGTDGIHHFRTPIAPHSTVEALHTLPVTLGIARPQPAKP